MLNLTADNFKKGNAMEQSNSKTCSLSTWVCRKQQLWLDNLAHLHSSPTEAHTPVHTPVHFPQAPPKHIGALGNKEGPVHTIGAPEDNVIKAYVQDSALVN